MGLRMLMIRGGMRVGMTVGREDEKVIAGWGNCILGAGR
jgi:hypothetical protein